MVFVSMDSKELNRKRSATSREAGANLSFQRAETQNSGDPYLSRQAGGIQSVRLSKLSGGYHRDKSHQTIKHGMEKIEG
jgi:peptidase E